MENLRKTLATVGLAGLLAAGTLSAPAFAADDSHGDKGGYSHEDKGRGHDRKDERNNGEVDVVVKHKKHGKWESKRYEDVKLEKAASIAKDKADGGDWKKYLKDAKYTDKTDKTVHSVDKWKVDVYFEQDDDDRDHGHKG